MIRPAPARSLYAGMIVLVAIIPSIAASEPSQSPNAMATRHCPVMPDEEIDESVFYDWKGTRVYFCCERCKAKFIREPEKYASAITLTPVTTSRPAQVDRAVQGPKLLNWLGKFHPVTVHLPIGVLFAALLAEILFALSKNPLFANAGRFCVWVAALTGLVTAILGWFLGGIQLVDTDWLLRSHRWLGSATATALFVLLWISEHIQSGSVHRTKYRVVLFCTACLIAATGFFGGAMVWGLNHYAW